MAAWNEGSYSRVTRREETIPGYGWKNTDDERQTLGQESYNWDDLASVRAGRKKSLANAAVYRREMVQNKYGLWSGTGYAGSGSSDYQHNRYGPNSIIQNWGDPFHWNHFYEHGLGKRSNAGLTVSQARKMHVDFFSAQASKFERREQTLLAWQAAGGRAAYEQQATDRAELAISHPDAARAAEILRSETGGSPRPRTPGGASLGQSRPGDSRSVARRNERQRNPVRRPSGSVSRKRLRAASMLGQPLGGGSQSAAQLLG
jgi:hypothetical protein